MAKKQIAETRTEVVTGNGAARAITSTQTIDDSCLPSPGELEHFMKIDPGFAQHFMKVALNEQQQRHDLEKAKMASLDKEETRKARTRRLGMTFAFLLILVMLAVTAFSLWLDRPWFAGISFFISMLTVISTFVTGKPNQHTS